MDNPSNTQKTTASHGKEQLHLVDTATAESETQINLKGTSFPDEAHGQVAGGEISASCKSGATYIEHQAVMDEKYKRDFKKWTSGMNPRELQKIKEMGLHQPKVSYKARGAPMGDLADSSMASYEPDIAALIDGEDENKSDEPSVPDVVEVLRHLLAILISYPNTRLTLDCLTLVFASRAYSGESMTEISKRHGIKPAAVSKRCVKLTKEFDIPPPRAMQSLLARENHRKARIKSNREKLP